MSQLPDNEDDLVKECEKMNVSFDNGTIPDVGLDRAEMQRRLLAAWAERRNSRLWIIALMSSLASIVSAVAAIVAVFCKC